MNIQLYTLLAFVGLCSALDVSLTSTCTSLVNGTCTGWSHSGSVSRKDECFPADAFILASSGSRIRMDQLRLGDIVQTSCGPEPTTLWLHRNTEYSALYHRVHVGRQSLTLSAYHNILTDNGYLFAKDLKVGDVIHTNADVSSFVTNITTVTKLGLYAPYTACGDFYVGDRYESFRVHAFAHIQYPQLYNPIFRSLAIFYTAEQPTETEYIHPLARRMISGVGEYLIHRNSDWKSRRAIPASHTSSAGTHASASSGSGSARREEEALQAVFGAIVPML